MAQQVLPQLDRFWLLNAIGAAHFFSDRMDDAIRFLYEALETLRGSERSRSAFSTRRWKRCGAASARPSIRR